MNSPKSHSNYSAVVGIKRKLHAPANTHLLLGVLRLLTKMETAQHSYAAEAAKNNYLTKVLSPSRALDRAIRDTPASEFHPYFPDLAVDIKQECKELIEELVIDFHYRLNYYLAANPEILDQNKDYFSSQEFKTSITTYLKSILTYRKGKTIKPASPLQKLLSAKKARELKLINNSTKFSPAPIQKGLF